MAEKVVLAELLKQLLKEIGVGQTSLVNLVNDRVGLQLVNRRNLQNWLSGDTQKPRSWQPFIGIAIGLRLNSEATDQLLSAAGKPPLAELWPRAEGSDLELLQIWQETNRQQPDESQGVRPIPLDIPSGVYNFTGREETIEEVLVTLEPGKVIALCGPAGVGKTALAVEIINRLVPGDTPPTQFPDGVIYYPFYEQPAAAQALKHIIDVVMPFPIADEGLLRDAVRRVLAGKRTLLVLDGTEVCDDLGSVLAVRGTCGVLLTSRYKKDAAQRRFDIEALSKTEAATLLRKWAETRADSDEAVAQICDLVGRLPLAIRLIGSHLSQSGRTATEFLPVLEQAGLKALAFPQRQRESVALLLKKNTERLSEPAAQTLAIAGLLAFAPFLAEVIAAAQNLSVGEVQEHLDELVIWSLLDRPGQPYHLVHLLAHQFVQQYLADLVNKEQVHRLLTYYLTLVQERSDQAVEDYTRLDGYLPHIVALITKGTAEALWQSTLSLSKGIDDFLDIRGQWGHRVAVNRSWLVAAQNLKNRLEEGQAYQRLGTSYLLQGNFPAGAEALKQAFDLAVELGDRPLKALVELNWGNLLMRQENQAAALAKYQSSLDTYRALNNRGGQARVLNGMGNAEMRLGNYHQARTWFEQVLALFQELGDPKNARDEAKALDNLGLCHRHFGNFKQALEVHHQALAKFREVGDIQAELVATMNAGNVFLELEDFDQAVEQYQTASQMSRLVGDIDSRSKVLINLGITYRKQEKYDLAIKALGESLHLADRLENDARMGGVYNTLGLIYFEMGSPEQAIRQYESALTYFRRINSSREEATALYNLGNAYTELNRFDVAEQSFQKALAMFEASRQDRYQIYPLKALGDLYQKQENMERAQYYWEQALAIAKPEWPEYKRLTDLLKSLDQ